MCRPPSFFLTSTIGLAQGLFQGLMTLSSCIWWSCWATSWHTANGRVWQVAPHVNFNNIRIPSVSILQTKHIVKVLQERQLLLFIWIQSRVVQVLWEQLTHLPLPLGLSSLETEVVWRTGDSFSTDLASGSSGGIMSACIARCSEFLGTWLYVRRLCEMSSLISKWNR